MTMMTRKDYISTAAVIRAEVDLVTAGMNSDYSATARMTLADVAGRLADMFAKDNPRFDRDRFLSAAGVPDEH